LIRIKAATAAGRKNFNSNNCSASSRDRSR
jgi:hypothetical protein